MKIDKPDIGDYFISYKGHGMIERASKTNSIAHVIAHENRHIAEFRNRAEYQGKEIVAENISVRYAFVDGKIVAVAGEATATMRDKTEEGQKSLVVKRPENANINIEKHNGAKDDSKKQKIDILLTRVQSALDKIESKIKEAENRQGNDPNRESDDLTRIRQKKTMLEVKKDKLAKKKNELDAEKLKEMVDELLGGVSGLIDQAANLMKAIYGLKSGKQTEQNSDNSNEIEVPDYSMLYTGMMLDTVIF